jgi:hypothetical protein
LGMFSPPGPMASPKGSGGGGGGGGCGPGSSNMLRNVRKPSRHYLKCPVSSSRTFSITPKRRYYRNTVSQVYFALHKTSHEVQHF